MLDVERWAELRREHFVRGVSIKELARRTGLARNTVRSALRADAPPGFRCRTFDDLTDTPEWAEEIRRVYGGDIERVDLMVGMYAEPRPRGFAFSDTAFRIFVLMASRRLNSDRFFTTDYTPEVYTPAGMQWINDNTMGSVLLRHFPELAPALRGVGNAFAPWSGPAVGGYVFKVAAREQREGPELPRPS